MELLSILAAPLCALIGTLLGVLASAKVTVYRIGELEKKVDKHNNLIDRTYRLEERMAVMEEHIKK